MKTIIKAIRARLNPCHRVPVMANPCHMVPVINPVKK